MSAKNEIDLYSQLQSAGMELMGCSDMDGQKGIGSFSLGVKKVRVRDLIQLFMHLEQMQSAGVPMLDSLADIRDTTDHTTLRDVMSEIHRDVSEGSSLSESMSRHPKVFGNLYISLISAGEDTGDLTSSYLQLMKFLKWMDMMQSQIKKATRYPIILLAAVLLVMVVMMGYVVPEVVGFIKNIGQELPFYTIWLINTSEFFQSYWWAILGGPPAVFIGVKALKKMSGDFAYRLDYMMLSWPVYGNLTRKINIARYAQTFGALFASGIDIVNCLVSSRATVNNLALIEAVEAVEAYVQAGSPLSEAFSLSGEFPSLVTRMIKIGEESGNLTSVLEQVSEFYTKDVDEAIQGMIAMIEPMLTAFLGIMILWIAAAVFGPIYSSFENIGF
jgi:type IV pilus assembly protein PilC|tara:strand:- start:346051 stop:347211 length:1161 start_codon:yes stop_codon:yes gene_type:complete